MENNLTEKQQELFKLMSDISEDCYFAGWLSGNEYSIWNAIVSGRRRYGIRDINETHLEKCKQLSKELDGWIVWDDDIGGKFIPMDEWLAMYQADEDAARRIFGH